jgi:valyl-tRNA synthetase
MITMIKDLPSTYDPEKAEKDWYSFWEENGYFHADETDDREPFSIVIPPPNVTGSLHMGHALNNTLQDILARWKRMQGCSVLWMPGTDHAGIATQNVVEKLLAGEGTSKDELGREGFEERVWKWKEESGGQIVNQLRRLGCSLDWERERFTLDEGLSRAVREVFVTLYEEGLLYRGYRIINWCPRCETALSDIETEYRDMEGHLWHIRYPVKGSDEHIVVATTRPETMLGDTGVAVNPEDDRYRHLVGKTVILPLMDREIPVFSDEYVSMEFGSGLVKVTPAHDPNDFEMGRKHGLESIIVLDENGVVNEKGGAYRGLDRYQARKKIIEDLEKQGLLVQTEKHDHSVGHCYRCDTVIEPYLSKQWFVSIKPLAQEAIRAVEEGKITFHPASWSKIYFEWMYNIRDWCVSRQLWWGHRIPAFYCDDCGHVTVVRHDPDSCEECGSANIRQDEDVLDTWFSSGLWPFSTMGWPDENKTLEKYYPTSVLLTAFDIIFFWVARMIMMGMKFMDDVPFREVYIHALIRDEHGHKMSKSRGNVIDPLVTMEKYGTDAFRFTLAAFAAQGRDIIMSEKRIEGYRAFANKIWNATRFILMNLGDSFQPGELKVDELMRFDRWILHSLNRTVEEVNRGLETYRFNDSANALYDFWWHRFCDWYLELAKKDVYGDDPERADTVRQVLFHVLRQALKLLHPFMPFITEEIWSYLKGNNEEPVIIAPWPGVNPAFDSEERAREAEVFMELVYRIRNIRGEMNVPPEKKATVVFKTGEDDLASLIEEEKEQIRSLARLEKTVVDAGYEPADTDAVAVISGCEIYMPLEGLIDFDREKERLDKEIGRIQNDLARVEGKLSNEKFMNKAPAEVIEKEKEKQKEFRELLEKLETSRSKLG